MAMLGGGKHLVAPGADESTAQAGEALVGRVARRDWAALTLPEQIQHMELEGYCVFPGTLSPGHIAEIKALAADWPTDGRDYSERQRNCPLLATRPVQAGIAVDDVDTDGADDHPSEGSAFGFISPILQGPGGAAVASVISHAPTLGFLQALLGQRVVCFSFGYDRSEVGTPGLSLHAGAKPFGARVSQSHYVDNSAPIYLRALYYLDDLTLDVSPFRIVPRSHICLHADANPYQRYESHPEQIIVPVKAGSLILFHERCFHGTLPNVGGWDRSVLALGWRPAWAGPIARVTEWDPEELELLPAAVQELICEPNTHEGVVYSHPSKPEGMADVAPGMSPSRWSAPRL